MSAQQPAISLRLCAPDGEKVNLDKAGHLLNSLQNLAWHMGSYIEGQPYSEGGRLKKQIMDNYQLVIKSISSGSVDVEVVPSLVSGQATLEGFDSFQSPGVRVITKITDLLEAAYGEDGRSLDDVVSDTAYKSRLLLDVSSIWPKEPGYTLQFKGQGDRCFEFQASNRDRLERLVSGRQRHTGEEVHIGILADLRVENGKMMRIERIGERIAAEYPPELEPKARELLGSPVRIIGRAERSSDSAKIKKFHIDNLELYDSYQLDEFEAGERRFTPIMPINIQVDYEDGFWILSVPYLDAIGRSEDYFEAEEMLMEYIDFLWTEYVSCPDSDLGETGKMLRDLLQSMFKVG